MTLSAWDGGLQEALTLLIPCRILGWLPKGWGTPISQPPRPSNASAGRSLRVVCPLWLVGGWARWVFAPRRSAEQAMGGGGMVGAQVGDLIHLGSDPVTPLTGCVASGKKLNLSGPLFAYLEVGAACETRNEMA